MSRLYKLQFEKMSAEHQSKEYIASQITTIKAEDGPDRGIRISVEEYIAFSPKQSKWCMARISCNMILPKSG